MPQTFDNRRVIISNSVISNTVTVNLTAVHPRVMAIIPFSISCDAKIDHGRVIALELADVHANFEDVAGCPVVILITSSVDLSLSVRCPDPTIAASERYDLTEAIKKRFDLEGFEIPFA